MTWTIIRIARGKPQEVAYQAANVNTAATWLACNTPIRTLTQRALTRALVESRKVGESFKLSGYGCALEVRSDEGFTLTKGQV